VLEHPGRRKNQRLEPLEVKSAIAKRRSFAMESTHVDSASESLALSPRLRAGRPRTWLREIIPSGQIVETCPAWCTSSHHADTRGMLDDLVHVGDGVELEVETFDHWSDGTPVSLPSPVLRADVRIDPYSANPKRNVPFVSFEPWQDEVMDELGPEEFAAVIAQVRAHCDRLEGVLAQLVQARAEHAGQTATA
jgi:hypothetical protein